MENRFFGSFGSGGSGGGGATQLNDLTDVNTGLPIPTTQADDGRLLYYDFATQLWVSSEEVNIGTVVIDGKKSTAGTIAKGLPVYLVGFDADVHTVELADATSSATMPVIGFTAEPFNDTDAKHLVTFGKLTGLDTTSTVSTLNPNGETWAVNDALYVSTTAGGLTKVRPTGGTTEIQRVAKILKVDATGGQIFIFNTARTSGLPNLNTDNIWIGDANGNPSVININTLIAGTLSNGSGTTANGTAIDLGGTLTSDAVIKGAGSRNMFLGQNNATDYLNIITINATQNIEVYNAAFGGVFSGTSVTKNPAVHNITNNIAGASVQHIVDGAKVQSLVSFGTIISESTVTTQEAKLLYNDNGVGSELNLSLLANIFTDNTSAQQGIVYAGDYSATFVGNSLVSKTYVDNALSGVSSIYTQDDTIGSGRVATLTDTLTFNGGSGAIFKLYSTLRTDDIFQVFFNGGGEWLAKNGSIDIGAGTTYSNYFTRFYERGIKFYGSGVVVHEINNTTGNVYFMNDYMAGGTFTVGSNSPIGSEKISFQNRTAVKGADTLSTSTAFEIYDGDTTPTKLWDFRNDGSLFGYKSKTNLIAQNSIGNNDAEYILRLRTAADSGNYAWFGNDGEIKLGAGVLDNSTGDRTTNIIWSNGSITRSGTGQYATLLGSNITANYSGEIVVGMGRYVTLSAARTVAIGRQVHALGEGAVSIGNAVSLSIYSQGLGSNISSSGIYNTMVGRNLNTSANYAGIWGYGIDNVNKLDNGTTNSLALGWNTTTPQHLFFQTGAYIGGSSAIGTEDISLQGNTLIDGTLDMNNNRVLNTIVNPTVQETTSTATLTINATNENTGVLTAQAVALTVANPTGTIVQGQKLVYRIKDNGTARAITWGANFRAIGVTLPTTTTANKLLYVGCIYNTTDSKWDVVAVNEEA